MVFISACEDCYIRLHSDAFSSLPSFIPTLIVQSTPFDIDSIIRVWFKPRASIVLADLCAHFPRAEDISGMAKFFCFFQQKKAWRFTLNHKGFSLGYDLVYCQNKSRVCLC
ncbi:hypothetical protein SUGI_0577820 [Cryptomeria japonica]|nr:hypothetical protein SUGI_0577820 [Cryptomeria japonica]